MIRTQYHGDIVVITTHFLICTIQKLSFRYNFAPVSHARVMHQPRNDALLTSRRAVQKVPTALPQSRVVPAKSDLPASSAKISRLSSQQYLALEKHYKRGNMWRCEALREDNVVQILPSEEEHMEDT
jgi:hypothetical protein